MDKSRFDPDLKNQKKIGQPATVIIAGSVRSLVGDGDTRGEDHLTKIHEMNILL